MTCITLTETRPSTLFSPKLISPEVQNSLPNGYLLRPLKRDDYKKGVLEILAQLSTVGEITQKQFEERFDLMQNLGSYYLIVIEDNDRIVACATLIIEYKLLHGCGKTGHIEDVVVHDSQRGKRLGQRLIEQINHMAKSLGCYKSILNCNQHNVPFYEKCNLSLANVQMAHYFDRD
ncbi:acyl-CoA N-acyltransferase [Phycomyces blakesleeanus]|uniref:Glucosamine 6-phosphate N-acetyltransferase n=2 Tax=Phycomyces blakesleeanus TaxID=4837 RepID=A0A167KUX8_PHYB8|nr:hypothetical protein PHYBLDRAFT_127304 [Phycomyces blakesleeanus NRRL 1555(-)]OAD68939.1 hypothetical protein PHYBLDRAFT_127304 [Phycomyces blakesleeanus NRRL 1555(-)]|eukprot:XP_018286979.1 hypothetical protein PHYBLDRAFT_127304 [Phycomyces blakesleeanus NRRL 1555(-)]